MADHVGRSLCGSDMTLGDPVRALLILGITQIVGWGTTYYTPTVLAPATMAETGWSKTFVYMAFSWSLLFGAVLAAPAGRLIDRVGGRLAMSAGSVLAALGCVVQASASAPWAFVVSWTILGGAMRLMLYEPAFATLTHVAGRDARRYISYLTIPGGFASSVFWPIGYVLAQEIGWRNTLYVFAALNLLVCLPLHLLLPVHKAHEASGASGAAPAATSAILTGPARAQAVLFLTLALALNQFVFSALSAHFVTIFTALGLAASVVVAIAALKGAAQVAGRLWEIFHGRKFPAMVVGLVATGLLPLAFLPLPLGVTVTTLLAFTLLYGASNGLVTIVRGAVPLELFGTQGYGQLLGRMTGPGLVMAAIAPGAFAGLTDLFGVGVALGSLFAAAMLSFVLIVWLSRAITRSGPSDV
jgi:predicted MFS family arabinose efflux permease